MAIPVSGKDPSRYKPNAIDDRAIKGPGIDHLPRARDRNRADREHLRGSRGVHGPARISTQGRSRGEGLRIGVQMILLELPGRSITDATIEQLFDESLIDELEKEGFFKAYDMR